MIFDTRLNKIIQFSRFQCEYEENANVCYCFTIEFQIICLLQPINGSNYRSIIMMINRQVLITNHLSRMLYHINWFWTYISMILLTSYYMTFRKLRNNVYSKLIWAKAILINLHTSRILISTTKMIYGQQFYWKIR